MLEYQAHPSGNQLTKPVPQWNLYAKGSKGVNGVQRRCLTNRPGEDEAVVAFCILARHALRAASALRPVESLRTELRQRPVDLPEERAETFCGGRERFGLTPFPFGDAALVDVGTVGQLLLWQVPRNSDTCGLGSSVLLQLALEE